MSPRAGSQRKLKINLHNYVTLKSNLTCDIDMDVVLTLESGINAIFKGSTTKSVLSDSDPRSVGKHMLGSSLHSSRDSVAC